MKTAKYLGLAIFTLLIFSSGMVLFWYLSNTDLLVSKKTIINVELMDSIAKGTSNQDLNSRTLESIASSKTLYENKLGLKCDVQKVASYSILDPQAQSTQGEGEANTQSAPMYVKTALTLSCR